jgi:hypothetical protein
MNKKEATVTIALKKHTLSCKVEYDTLEDLVSSVNELLTPEEEPLNPAFIADNACILLPPCDGGGAYKWNVTLAHYCFGEGYISETRLAEGIFKAENALKMS